MVCRALCDELPCTAKVLHPMLVSERNTLIFRQECQLLSSVKHPNIIQYLGTHLERPNSLVLLMELMDESLTSFLERSALPLPIHTEVNLCHDISLALAYLHANDVIHRDLSSNNILLSGSKRAKVTDFGMSKLIGSNSQVSKLTQGPGCPVYMSPEAMTEPPTYSSKPDIFSFGVLTIQILSGKYPDPGPPRKRQGNTKDGMPIEVLVPDIERRKAHIDLVDPSHPLLCCALVCLSYEEKQRPTAQEVCYQMAALKKNVKYTNSVQEYSERTLSSQLAAKELQLKTLCGQLEAKDQELVRREAQFNEERKSAASKLQDMEAELQRQLSKKSQQISDLQRLLELAPTKGVAEITSERASVKAFADAKGLPSHIIKVSEEKLRQEQERNYCKFRLFWRHPFSSEIHVFETKVGVHKDFTILEATKEAYKVLELQNFVPIDRCRLVRYDEYSETLGQSFDDPEETFGQAVGGVRSYYSFELFMEIRNEDQKFRRYNRGGISLKIYVIDVSTKMAKEPVVMRAETGWTVEELKKEIAEQFNMNMSLPTMRLAFELSGNESKLLSVDTNTLKSEGLYRKHTVFVCSDPEDFHLQYIRSTMFTVVDKHIASVLLSVTFPTPGGGSRLSSGPAPCPKTDVQPFEVKLKTMSFRVDRRSTVEDLKKCLESHVGLKSSEFKIYRLYTNNQEFELTRLNETFQSIPSESKLIVKPGRALLPGEYRIKVYLLRMNNPEFRVFMLDTVVSKGMSIRHFKEQLLKDVTSQGLPFELNIERMRVRKKTWRCASTIYLDDQVFEKDIPLYSAFGVYIEQLKSPEQMKDKSNMQVYVRRWHPSTYTVDPTDEVIITESNPSHLKKRISQLSGIPCKRVAIAKGFGAFPSEISVLEIEEDLEWNPDVSTISSVPLSICDDGSIIYYKDSSEKIAELSAEKRTEMQKRENTRLSKYIYNNASGTSTT